MKLWLLRHGEAEPLASEDAERQLTETGRDEVRETSAHLPGSVIGKVLVSPYVRARQTADIVCQALAYQGQVTIVPWLTPESSPDQAISALNGLVKLEENVLLVSHQPFLGALCSLLIHGNRQQSLPIPIAGLLELQGELPSIDGMQLLGQYFPR